LNDPPIFSQEFGVRNPIRKVDIITKKLLDQYLRILSFRDFRRSLIGISSWDLLAMFLKTALPFFNSSSPRIRT